MNLFPGGGPYAGLGYIDFGIRAGDKVLDVGSGDRPMTQATHLIDLPDNDNQRHGHKLVTQGKELIEGDVCVVLKDFPDNYFDFCYSSHTFEHIDDLPLALDLISAKCRRGFYAFPGSDFEFFTAQSHYGHVNLCRQIGDTLHITKRPPNTVIDIFGKIYEGLATTNIEGFNHYWEETYRFIWEIRHLWDGKIKYKYYDNPSDLYPQVKYFK